MPLWTFVRSGWAARSTDGWRTVGATCPGMEATGISHLPKEHRAGLPNLPCLLCTMPTTNAAAFSA